jgi:hypothetical protein
MIGLIIMVLHSVDLRLSMLCLLRCMLLIHWCASYVLPLYRRYTLMFTVYLYLYSIPLLIGLIVICRSGMSPASDWWMRRDDVTVSVWFFRIMSALTNSPTTLARYAGIFKGTIAAGMRYLLILWTVFDQKLTRTPCKPCSVCFGIDAVLLPFYWVSPNWISPLRTAPDWQLVHILGILCVRVARYVYRNILPCRVLESWLVLILAPSYWIDHHDFPLSHSSGGFELF